MTGRWTTTAFLKRASLLCLVGGGLLLLAGCGGGDSPTPTAPSPPPAPAPPPPPPPPPPTPVTRVIGENSSDVGAFILLNVPFTTTATGTIGVTVDWTFPASNLNMSIYLARGTDPCTIPQFNSGQCAFLGFVAGTNAKPKTLSVPNLAAGPYTLYVGNSGSTKESVSFQITLTSVPGASASSMPSTSFGGIKGFVSGIIESD